jgi:hypothetical protein
MTIKRLIVMVLASAIWVPPSHADFLDTFTGSPSAPEPFRPSAGSLNWDIAVHSREINSYDMMTPMQAQHSADCGAPIDSSGNLITHYFDGNYDEAVFRCRDHVMTAIRAGVTDAPDEATVPRGSLDSYGVIYLTPNHLLDFSAGTATLKFDVTTFLTSHRDWIDIWITPFNQSMQLPLDNDLPDLQGHPRDAIHLRMDTNTSGGAWFRGALIQNFQATALPLNFATYETILTPSPKDRTTFQLDLSRTHIRFGIPAQTLTNNRSMIWIDTDIPTLPFDKATIQLGHHSYNPNKDCGTATAAQCGANTWHWDNVSLTPSTPFTIIKGNRRLIKVVTNDPTQNTPDTVTFPQPAPASSFLRFSAMGTVELSFNGGTQWTPAVRIIGDVEAGGNHHPEHFSSYFTPIPAGTQSVRVRLSADGWFNGPWPYAAKDFSIWSMTVNNAGGVVCDINRDTVVNVSDVQQCINQAIQIVPCTTADINLDGNCTVVDVQRVVNAVLGSACVSP